MKQEKTSQRLSLGQVSSTEHHITSIRPQLVNDPGNKVNRKLFLDPNPDRKGEGGLRRQELFKCSAPDNPLVSIITVVFNGDKHLENAIQSVINQTYENIEYIIIDAGSTDGTLDIIKKYEGHIDYWISEPDKGIYDGMNKGISLSTGEVIGLLNSDDWYENYTVHKVVEEYHKSSPFSIFFGDIRKFSLQGKATYLVPSTYPRKSLIYGCTINHPSCFVNIKTYQKIGVFNLSFDIAADYEFLLRAWKANINFYYISSVLTNFRVGGISTNFRRSAIQANNARRLNGINWAISIISMTRLFIMHYTKKLLKLFGFMKPSL